MRWIIAMCALLWTMPVHAQQFDQTQLIESLRPRMSPRALSRDERVQSAAAITALKLAPDADAIARVRPFAEAGDAGAIRAIMDAYTALRTRAEEATRSRLPATLGPGAWDGPTSMASVLGSGDPEPLDILSLTEDVYRPLEALWAIPLWRTGARDWMTSAAIARCLPPNTGVGVAPKGTRVRLPGRNRSHDCGFDISITEGIKRVETISKIPTKDRSTALVERPISPWVEVQRGRFDYMAMHMRAGGQIYDPHLRNYDYAWVRQLGLQVPVFRQPYNEAAFEYLRKVKANRSHVAPGSPVMAYIRADPKRLAEFNRWPADIADAHARIRESFGPENARFDAAMASRNYTSNDRFWMARVALRERGERAQKWHAAFGHLETGPLEPYWCTAGVTAACDRVAAINRQVAAEKRGISNGGSGYVAPDLAGQMDAFKKREADINRGNCTRASMGANIICNP